jgi:FkbM family methyltransferase
MRSPLRRLTRRLAKSTLELVLPIAESATGFRTARGDYLPNRIKILIGRYEVAERNLMQPFLKPGQVIVDVGANVGYMSRFFAQSVGPTGKVCAFEPNPMIFSLLKRNVSKFKHAFAHNVALSTGAGEAQLFLAGRDHSVASFAREYSATHVFYQDSGELNSVSVKLVNGDDFLSKIDIDKIDVLKIDVEGWELNVLDGLERTIAASPNLTIFCEFNPAAQECAGHNKTELLNWFFDRGFSVSCPEHNQLRALSRSSVEKFVSELAPNAFVTVFALSLQRTEATSHRDGKDEERS